MATLGSNNMRIEMDTGEVMTRVSNATEVFKSKEFDGGIENAKTLSDMMRYFVMPQFGVEAMRLWDKPFDQYTEEDKKIFDEIFDFLKYVAGDGSTVLEGVPEEFKEELDMM